MLAFLRATSLADNDDDNDYESDCGENDEENDEDYEDDDDGLRVEAEWVMTGVVATMASCSCHTITNINTITNTNIPNNTITNVSTNTITNIIIFTFDLEVCLVRTSWCFGDNSDGDGDLLIVIMMILKMAK